MIWLCWSIVALAAAWPCCTWALAASQATLPTPRTLAEAPEAEVEALTRMLQGDSWPRRAIAALRLDRYECQQSRTKLEALLHDTAWQVRAFAVRGLARRGAAAQENWFSEELDPRVLRAALRHQYTIDLKRLGRGVQLLARSDDLKNKLLAAELGAASEDAELIELATDATKQIILRMNRAQAGAFSPRLAALTGQTDLHRPIQWQQWLMKTGRSFEALPAHGLDEPARDLQSSPFALLEPEQFAGVESYMATLSEHEVDLAICIDCTASMGGEIAAAQGGIDDMMLFMSDVVSSLRVGLVAYRDRSDVFETKGWEFTSDLAQLRDQLWQLSADGGGDEPEAVYPAMRLALSQLHWRPNSTKVMVVVGDAPPHVGYGALCANLAKGSRERAQLTTHAIQAKGKDVKHFAEIAEAGGGRCVLLSESDSLIAEITGLTLGDRYDAEFREFFQVYLELCR